MLNAAVHLLIVYCILSYMILFFPLFINVDFVFETPSWSHLDICLFFGKRWVFTYCMLIVVCMF